MRNVVGLFDRHEDAEHAINELAAHGFGKSEINVIVRKDVVPQHWISGAPQASGAEDPIEEVGGKSAAGGAVMGGLGGLLVGAGVVTIPGLGPVLASGTLASVLIATVMGTWLGAVTGGLVGGVMGALVQWDLSEAEARVYAEGVRHGGVLLAVQAEEDTATEVRLVLCNAGAVDVVVRPLEPLR